MGKFNYRTLPSNKRHQSLDELSATLLTIKSKKTMREFLQRLLTPSEQVMLSRRIDVAKYLIQGHSYKSIRRELGVGMSTIQAVHQWLEHVLPETPRQAAAPNRKKRRPRDMPGTFADTRHRYAAEFLLFNLLLD